MNRSPACIFEVSEIGNKEFSWSGQMQIAQKIVLVIIKLRAINRLDSMYIQRFIQLLYSIWENLSSQLHTL